MGDGFTLVWFQNTKNIFLSNLTWYCCHGINVSGSNPGTDLKSRNKWNGLWHYCWLWKGIYIEDSWYNTSIAECVRVWYTAVHQESIFTQVSLWSTVWCRVENYGCISKDNPWLLKMDYSQKDTEHREQKCMKMMSYK